MWASLFGLSAIPLQLTINSFLLSKLSLYKEDKQILKKEIFKKLLNKVKLSLLTL